MEVFIQMSSYTKTALLILKLHVDLISIRFILYQSRSVFNLLCWCCVCSHINARIMYVTLAGEVEAGCAFQRDVSEGYFMPMWHLDYIDLSYSTVRGWKGVCVCVCVCVLQIVVLKDRKALKKDRCYFILLLLTKTNNLSIYPADKCFMCRQILTHCGSLKTHK